MSATSRSPSPRVPAIALRSVSVTRSWDGKPLWMSAPWSDLPPSPSSMRRSSRPSVRRDRAEDRQRRDQHRQWRMTEVAGTCTPERRRSRGVLLTPSRRATRTRPPAPTLSSSRSISNSPQCLRPALPGSGLALATRHSTRLSAQQLNAQTSNEEPARHLLQGDLRTLRSCQAGPHAVETRS